MNTLHSHQDAESGHDHSSCPSVTKWYRTPFGLACLGLAVVAGYYLWEYHSQHVLAFLPFAIFLVCPLMHLFGHGGHGHQHRTDSTTNKPGGAS